MPAYCLSRGVNYKGWGGMSTISARSIDGGVRIRYQGKHEVGPLWQFRRRDRLSRRIDRHAAVILVLVVADLIYLKAVRRVNPSLTRFHRNAKDESERPAIVVQQVALPS